MEIAQGDPRYSLLAEAVAVAAADLAGTPSGAGPFTAFAATHAPFASPLTELGVTQQQVLADKTLLRVVLQYHVLGAQVPRVSVPVGKAITPLQGGIFKIDSMAGGRVLKADVPVGSAITTVQGQTFTIDGTLTVTDGRGRKARITGTDVLASNGVVHVLDTVILPKP